MNNTKRLKINFKKKTKKILVDMTVSILHHGHIRLLKKASKLGNVYVGLTKDTDVKKHKGYNTEIKFKHRKEILEAIKYVYKVIPSNFLITNKYIKDNKFDFIIHGSDYRGDIEKKKTKVFKRTKNISSTKLRNKIYKTEILLKYAK